MARLCRHSAKFDLALRVSINGRVDTDSDDIFICEAVLIANMAVKLLLVFCAFADRRF